MAASDKKRSELGEETEMEQKKLSRWLIIIIAGVAVCGLTVYALVLPICGRDLAQKYPEYEKAYWPWLIFLWLTGVPCYAVLWLGLGIVRRIGADRSFSFENAHALKRISYLATGDTAFFMAGSIALLLLNMSHPGVFMASLMVVFAGIAVAVVAASLSHLVLKAAALQEQSDLTV